MHIAIRIAAPAWSKEDVLVEGPQHYIKAGVAFGGGIPQKKRTRVGARCVSSGEADRLPRSPLPSPGALSTSSSPSVREDRRPTAPPLSGRTYRRIRLAACRHPDPCSATCRRGGHFLVVPPYCERVSIVFLLRFAAIFVLRCGFGTGRILARFPFGGIRIPRSGYRP